jgi:hypothetical protein
MLLPVDAPSGKTKNSLTMPDLGGRSSGENPLEDGALQLDVISFTKISTNESTSFQV